MELNQQSAQNEKLRQTLVNMQDLMAHEKNVGMKMAKDLEEIGKHQTKITDHRIRIHVLCLLYHVLVSVQRRPQIAFCLVLGNSFNLIF